MIECPVRLRRLVTPAAAEAVLLPGSEPAVLASICTRTQDRLPTVFAVRGGFLVLPPAGAKIHSFPGAILLRRLAGDLFIPADAEMIPALLNEEIVALTRSQGLVLLPGGAALGFEASQPLPASAWLAPLRIDSGGWEPFPKPQELADRLRSIEGPPSPVVLEVLQRGQPPDADPLPGAGSSGVDSENAPPVPEDALPPSSSPGQRILQGARLGLAQTLAWLGRNLNMPGLAQRAAEMARRAIEQVPRLTEKILGEQEAALREVLRQLQSGDVEKALRRAPIAVADPDAGGSVGTNSSLGQRDPRFSLRDLLSNGKGAGGVGWLGGGDVWLRLADEYRRLAIEALRRGDHRRAAYLYGVLLRDLRSAANALMAGGHYRDAGILFRDRLHDEASAAAAFESAGDYDESLRLYDKLGQFETAAHLLRRLGDEERALDYFRKAADQLADRHRYLAAGDLIRSKAGRTDLARLYYRRGWLDSDAEAVTCGERLLDEFLTASDWAEMQALLADAQARFAPPRTSDAGRFFTYLLHVGKDFIPADQFEEITDRTRLFFAQHLRESSHGAGRANDVTSQLFGQGKTWPGSVARDAAFATRKAPRPPRLHAAAVSGFVGVPFRVVDGVVRAVVQSRGTQDMIVAANTRVVCWRADTGRIDPVCDTKDQEVLGLSTDPSAKTVYVLVASGRFISLLRFHSEVRKRFEKTGQFDWGLDRTKLDQWYLQPAVWENSDDQSVAAVATPQRRVYMIGPTLREEPRGPFLAEGIATHLLAVGHHEWVWDWDDRSLRLQRRRPQSAEFANAYQWRTDWVPGLSTASPLSCAPVDWVAPQPRRLEITAISESGRLFWGEYDYRDEGTPTSRTLSAAHPAGYVASCFVAQGKIAAVTAQNEVHWFRIGASLQPLPPQVTLAVISRAAAVASVGKDLIVVLEDGSVVRVNQP